MISGGLTEVFFAFSNVSRLYARWQVDFCIRRKPCFTRYCVLPVRSYSRALVQGKNGQTLKSQMTQTSEPLLRGLKEGCFTNRTPVESATGKESDVVRGHADRQKTNTKRVRSVLYPYYSLAIT